MSGMGENEIERGSNAGHSTTEIDTVGLVSSTRPIILNLDGLLGDRHFCGGIEKVTRTDIKAEAHGFTALDLRSPIHPCT